MRKVIISLTVITFVFTALCQYDFKGRIAVSSDGNQHDKDDICATPMTIALFASAGFKNKLVYYGHSDHIWDNNASQEQKMIESCEGTIERYAYDESVTKVFNAFRQTNEAINCLAGAIEASTADNPLWLIGAGPMEVIGRAIKKATKGKQHVTVISHSDWNNKHAAVDHNGYHFNNFPDMGVKTKQIKDQNGGLNAPYDDFNWLKNSSDPKLKWLWDRGQAAGKPKFDCSDCGMAYWLITGGVNGGDENGNPNKVKTILQNPVSIRFSTVFSNPDNIKIVLSSNRIGKVFFQGYKGGGMVTILNLKNQIIQTARLQAGQAEFNLNRNAKGVYILHFTSATKSCGRRIILK